MLNSLDTSRCRARKRRQGLLCWSAKPVDSHAHLSSVLLALLKRWELKEAPRAYRISQRRSESQSRSEISQGKEANDKRVISTAAAPVS